MKFFNCIVRDIIVIIAVDIIVIDIIAVNIIVVDLIVVDIIVVDILSLTIILTLLIQVEEHNIVVYVNATPYCTTIELEHHRGPCRLVNVQDYFKLCKNFKLMSKL